MKKKKGIAILSATIIVGAVLFCFLLNKTRENNEPQFPDCPLETMEVEEELTYQADGFFATDYKYSFFGKMESKEHSFCEDSLLFPPISGLIHKSVYSSCPSDTCFSEYAVLALKCPPISTLLDWLSDSVFVFANTCPIGNGLACTTDTPVSVKKSYFNSVNGICDYYMDQLDHMYDSWKCPGNADHDAITEQSGLLISDCWNMGNLYTFYRIDWYDCNSCGNNARESYYTVDAESGQPLGLADIVLPDKLNDLSALMMPHIINGKGEHLIQQNTFYSPDNKEVIKQADGCALLQEGLIIYFYPYNLGAGVDGQYEAIIPYKDLHDILCPTILNLLAGLE